MRCRAPWRMATLVIVLTLAGCATTKKITRTEWTAYDESDYKQEKSGVILEYKDIKEPPTTFFAQVQACDRTLAPLFDGNKPVAETVCFAQPGQAWFQLALTNNTGHVLRLNQTIMRLFDPAGNDYEAMAKDELIADFLSRRPCPTTQTVLPQFKAIKLFDRNTEVLPNTTSTGWLVFLPASVSLPGAWKLALYEVPIESDEAGKASKTTQFEIRQIVKKIEETWKGKEMVERHELEN